MVEIRQLSVSEGLQHLDALANVLVDCVEGGASVSFMAPFSKADAETFFRGILDEVAKGDCVLLAAFLNSELVGTVQIRTALPPNQPHRADVVKLLVLQSTRGNGIGARLMKHVEKHARTIGKTLLVLDTVTNSPAERLYLRLGWQRAGVIPNYALFPDGRLCDTTIFWKALDEHLPLEPHPAP